MTIKLTIGADPEYFVAKKDRPGIPIPACGLFGGGKKAPIFLTPEGGYLEDGCAVEFNVTPAPSVKAVKESLDRLVTAFLVLNKDYTIFPGSSAQFDKRQLRSHPQANIIGCDADFWAYGFRNKPQISSFKSMRFAGGHLHIGLDPWPTGLDYITVVKYLDTQLWMPFITNCSYDVNRFPHYGHPGIFRETPYGIEYRSFDNTWARPNEYLSTSQSEAINHCIDIWDRRILDMVFYIEKVGASLFTDTINKSLDYYGFNTRLATTNYAKINRGWNDHADEIDYQLQKKFGARKQ